MSRETTINAEVAERAEDGMFSACSAGSALIAVGQLAAESALAVARRYGYHGHIGGFVRSTNIANLRNRLTQYLREVRAGEEIVVRDRQRPIAKIVPLTVDDDAAEDTALVASGLMRKAERGLPRSFWRTRRPGLALRTAVAAVSEDREER